MPQHRGSPPRSKALAQLLTSLEEVHGWTPIASEPPRLRLVSRVDMRGINCRSRRTDQRPRERRASHGRRRRTSTSRDDGSPAGSDEPAPGRRTVYAYGLDGYRKAVAS
jgi:hypothetical protein